MDTMAYEDFPKLAAKVLMLFTCYDHHNLVKIRLEVLKL